MVLCEKNKTPRIGYTMLSHHVAKRKPFENILKIISTEDIQIALKRYDDLAKFKKPSPFQTDSFYKPYKPQIIIKLREFNQRLPISPENKPVLLETKQVIELINIFLAHKVNDDKDEMVFKALASLEFMIDERRIEAIRSILIPNDIFTEENLKILCKVEAHYALPFAHFLNSWGKHLDDASIEALCQTPEYLPNVVSALTANNDVEALKKSSKILDFFVNQLVQNPIHAISIGKGLSFFLTKFFALENQESYGKEDLKTFKDMIVQNPQYAENIAFGIIWLLSRNLNTEKNRQLILLYKKEIRFLECTEITTVPLSNQDPDINQGLFDLLIKTLEIRIKAAKDIKHASSPHLLLADKKHDDNTSKAIITTPKRSRVPK